MKTVIIYITLTLFSIQVTVAQQEQKVDSKYMAALIYLMKNEEVGQRIRNFHNQWLRKQKIKEDECISFNLSKYIHYISIPNLTHEVDFIKYLGSDSLIKNQELHRKKYYFELQELLELKKLVPTTDSKLYLLFSKPIDNYLMAEFMIKTSNHEIDMVTLKRGPALHILIFFDKNGLVEKIYTSGSYYN